MVPIEGGSVCDAGCEGHGVTDQPLAVEPFLRAVGNVVCQSRSAQRSAHSATSSLSPTSATPYASSRCCARVAAR